MQRVDDQPSITEPGPVLASTGGPDLVGQRRVQAGRLRSPAPANHDIHGDIVAHEPTQVNGLPLRSP